MNIAHRVLARCDDVFEGFVKDNVCSICGYEKLTKVVIGEKSSIYFCNRCWEELGIYLDTEKEIDCVSSNK